MTQTRKIARFVVGLTGGIGSGKTTTSDYFAQLGAYVVDVDVISRELTQPNGAATAAIENIFPSCVSAGVLNRDRLRSEVFGDVGKRLRLESILHPLIREESLSRITNQSTFGSVYVLLVVPLLHESDAYVHLIDCSVVVDTDVESQIARVTQTRNIDNVMARKIIAAQMDRGSRIRHSQFVVSNRSDFQDLQSQVVRLHRLFGACATQIRSALSPQAIAD